MPIYMDVHIVPGVKARDVAEAHRKDLLHQEEHGCQCMTYWIDEQRESIFCLIEAPEKEAVEEMHRRAHGLIPNKIIEVNNRWWAAGFQRFVLSYFTGYKNNRSCFITTYSRC
jgi:hypothetical protein